MIWELKNTSTHRYKYYHFGYIWCNIHWFRDMPSLVNSLLTKYTHGIKFTQLSKSIPWGTYFYFPPLGSQ